MSSSALFSSGGAGPSGIQTITGDTGGAVGPDISGNVDLIGSGGIQVAGDPLSNTLTISFANSGTFTTTTTNEIPVPVITIAVPEGQSAIITSTIVATEATGGDSFGGTIALTVIHYTGGDATVVGVPTINSNTTSTANILGSADTGTESAVISIAGVGGQTWNWSGTYQYIVV